MNTSTRFGAGALVAAGLAITMFPGASLGRSASAHHAGATARAAAVVKYRGKTRAGDPISFTLSGARITHLSAFAPALCLPTHGTPLSGTDPFDPPGGFKVGTTSKVTAKRYNEIWHTADVTKNFFVTTKRDRSGRIIGRLHVDYSFLMIIYSYPISSRPYVCTGDTTFKLAPAKKTH